MLTLQQTWEQLRLDTFVTKFQSQLASQSPNIVFFSPSVLNLSCKYHFIVNFTVFDHDVSLSAFNYTHALILPEAYPIYASVLT